MISHDDRSLPVWPLRVMAAVLCALGVVPMANIVAEGRGLAWWGPSVILWIIWGVMIGALSLILARTFPSACDAFVSRVHSALLRSSPLSFAIGVGVLTCALAIFFSWRLFHFQPVTIDELSVQWHAGLLTRGRLFAVAEPHAEFFSTMQTISVGDRWFTHFPIGAPAVMSIGMAVGAPWVVNPILAGVAAIVIYRFTTAIGPEFEARVVALFFALSPFVVFMAASQLDHLGALVAIWIAISALPRWFGAKSSSQARRSAAVVGVSLGVAATIRPYDAALVAIVIALFQLKTCRRNRALLDSLAVQLLAGAVPVALLLAANGATTGNPFSFAYDALNGATHRPGFHTDPFGATHTPRRGLYNISAYLMRVDITLLAWPIPAVVLVAASLACQRRVARWDYLLLGVLATLLVGYWAYWGEGRSLGPRFLFTAAPVLLIYIARLPGLWRERVTRPLLRRASTLLIPLWIAIAWLMPPISAQPFGVWTLAKRTLERDSATPLIVHAVSEQRLTNAVVFVADGMHARLTARLRALGASPFAAQSLVGRHDACVLQELLDSTATALSPAGRLQTIVAALDHAPAAAPIEELSAMEQLALTEGRVRSLACERELARARSHGVDLARFLPRMDLDADGRLGGSVIYARDFGERNAMLRDRFGSRLWYAARVEKVGDALTAVLEPLPRP